MPRPKGEFEALYPCDFYTPEELFDADQMYTVYEIARLLQELDPDAEIEESTEEVLLDWAIPWVMYHADELVVAEPPTEEEPGYYGRERDGDLSDAAGGESDVPAGADPDADAGAGDGSAER